MIMIDDLNVIR